MIFYQPIHHYTPMTNTFLLRILTWTILLRTIIALSLSLHPITIIILIIVYNIQILIIVYNIQICLNISFLKQTYIFSLLYFLIIISGLLIIFLYFSSLISNEKSKNYYNKPLLWITVTFPFTIIFNYSYSPNLSNISHLPWNSLLTIPPKLPWIPYEETIPLIYFNPLINLTLLRIIFLLITLLSIIKISTPKIKSLRQIII